MTEKRENKYREWVATIFTPRNERLENRLLEVVLVPICEKYAFQLEVTPTTEKYHFQVALKLKDRKRHSTLLNMLSKSLGVAPQFITIDRQRGTWEESVKYVTKEESRAPEAEPCLSVGTLAPYSGQDIKVLDDETSRFPWQQELFKEFFNNSPVNLLPANDREVWWITDEQGCSGKSLFIKYCCYNNSAIKKITFGTSHQLRSSVIDAGPALMYIVDIPRTKGVEDHLNNIITVVEDIKNGFVVSNFHGKSRQLMINPPHVLIFSNIKCPHLLLSEDRWQVRQIINKELYRYY